MKIYLLDVLGKEGDKALVTITEPPTGIGVYDTNLASGERIGAHYPADARIELEKRMPGRKLCSFIGNTISFLIVSNDVKLLFEAKSKAEIEACKFTLYDQKKRLLSEDYWIINPIGVTDCVNRAASEIEYLDAPGDPYHGAVVGVDKYVFDRKKVTKAPNLFRVPENSAEFFFKEPLVEEIAKKGFTNFVFEEVEVD